ncbi:hypothetical protein HYR54_07915 [Candidatus Acetothermia bacterium]|nr:hypothetical protein [Candidatus Acetothermia bacterium]
MRRKLGFILAMVLGLGGLLLAAVPARADSGSPLADARERANGILVQLQTLDNVCITILSALIHEVDIDVLEARKLITVGKGNLTRLLFDTLVTSAGEGFDRINATLEQCVSLLGDDQDGSDDGTVFGEVAGLQEDIGNLDNIDQRKRFKIDSLLENIVTGNLNSISDRVQSDGSIPSKTGSVEELLASDGPVGECLSDPENCSLENTELSCGEAKTQPRSEPIKAIPQLTESGPFSFEQLRDLKIVLGLAHQCLTRAIREVNRLPGFKKWVLKGVREVFELLRSSNFGGHGASEVIAVTAGNTPRVIADIREDFNGLLIELDTIDNVCVTILGALFNEELISVLEARKLITVGKGNLDALLEELSADFEATQEKIVNTIDQCANEDNGLIFTFSEELGNLSDEIDGLRESKDGTLDNRKATKIVSLLELAKTLTGDILEHIGTLKDDSETLKDKLVSCTENLRSDSADLHVQPQLTESGPFSFGQLREFKICLGEVYAQLRSFLTVIREFTRHKKWILKAVRETRELLRNTNFGGHGTSEITGLTAGVTKIYTLGGALITTQVSGLNVNSLANGVYLAVTELRDALGNVHQQIRKVTVVH